MDDETNFPPIAGATRQTATTDKCPADGTPLDRYAVASMEFEACPQCHGLWLDQGELRELKNQLGDGRLHWLNDEVDNLEKASATASTRSCAKCPETKLISVKFGHSSVVLEWCPQCHGVWLDRGEYDAIVAYLQREAKSGTASEKDDAGTGVEAFVNATIFEHPALFSLLTGIARAGRGVSMD